MIRHSPLIIVAALSGGKIKKPPGHMFVAQAAGIFPDTVPRGITPLNPPVPYRTDLVFGKQKTACTKQICPDGRLPIPIRFMWLIPLYPSVPYRPDSTEKIIATANAVVKHCADYFVGVCSNALSRYGSM